VQGTLALEMQDLEEDSLKNIITNYEQAFLEGEYKSTLWVA